jgi:hypothetical protein
MFEDFRKQTDDSLFQDDDQQTNSPVDNRGPEGHFFGMTPVQRFIVSVMLLMMTVVLGILFLLVTSKVVPPFMG